MKLWVDAARPAPEGYEWCSTVNIAIAIAIAAIELWEDLPEGIELIDLDYDAGDFACDGGNYICLFNWLEETGRNYPIHIHSMNVVGVANMRRIIERNGWKELR